MEKCCDEYLGGNIYVKNDNLNKKILDYSFSSVSDSDIKNPLVQQLNKILSKFEIDIYHLEKYHPGSYIKIDLSDNYLRDNSIKELSEFLMKKKHLRKKLRGLKLRNNKITISSCQILEVLLQKFPKLKIDISINHISINEFDKLFNKNERIKFNIY